MFFIRKTNKQNIIKIREIATVSVDILHKLFLKVLEVDRKEICAYTVNSLERRQRQRRNDWRFVCWCVDVASKAYQLLSIICGK